ncbi:MAG: hypothetical protein Kow006_11800 [Gammaproteobacteria bacterium]
MARDTIQLTSEDHLRLSVLMAQAEAVRIDESSLRVYGLIGGESREVQLHPNCPEYRYLQGVRHLLAEIVLGQPWGFPTFIHRWTRTGTLGSIRDQRNLLKLGEPEAVKALAASAELAPELYELVWWAQPTAETARTLLAQPGGMPVELGRELAAYLVEHLPFETDPVEEMEAVRQVAAPGLLDEPTRRSLWKRRERKPQYRVGFLRAAGEPLLDPEPAHPGLASLRARLCPVCQGGNAVARSLHRLLDSGGQTFLREAELALLSPGDQEIFSAAVNRVGEFVDLPLCPREREMTALLAAAEERLEREPEVRTLLAAEPSLEPMIRALLVLGGASERLFYHLFSRTTATGSLLRRKLDPLTEPLRAHMAELRPQAFTR